MRMNIQLDEAIQIKLGNGQPSLDDFRKLSGPIDLQLKVSRQIGRQLQLRNRKREKRN